MFIPSLNTDLLGAPRYSRHCGFQILGFPNSFYQHFSNQNASITGSGWTAREKKGPGVPGSLAVMLFPEPLLGPRSPGGTLSHRRAPVGVEAWPRVMWHAGWLGRCKVRRPPLWEFSPLPTAPSLGHPQTATRGVTLVSSGGPHSPNRLPLLHTGVTCPVSLILQRQTEAQGGHGFAEGHTPGRS